MNAKLAVEYLNWFNIIWERQLTISRDDITQFIAPAIQLYINGKLMVSGADDYVTLINALREQKLKLLEIKMPVQDIVAQGDRVAVSYLERLTYHDGHVDDMVYTAFMRFDTHGKIIKLYLVFNKQEQQILT